MNNKRLFSLLPLIFLGIALVWYGGMVAADQGDNVTGWAWSDMPTSSDQITTPDNHSGGRGLGWISLNSSNSGSGGGSYGVKIDQATGKFSGYGWSEYGGWVDFSPSGGFPEEPFHGAQVDPTCLASTTGCAITGWIRYTSAPNDPQAGGWDGWVKMSGTSRAQLTQTECQAQFPEDYPNCSNIQFTYGVRLLAPTANGTRSFSGKAWGARVVGWVDFQWATVKLDQEICNDGIDNDNDGQIDENCSQKCNPPLVEHPNQPLVCVCPVTFNPPVNGTCPTPEICNDGIDNDNDGQVDENCTEICGNNIDDNGNDFIDENCPVCPTPNPNPNYPGIIGYNAQCPCVGAPGNQCDGGQLNCPDGSPVPPGGICPGGAVDQCQNIIGFQQTVVPPLVQVTQLGVKNCYIIGCADPNATNYNPAVTMQATPNRCTYGPGAEICWNKKDDDGDGQIDENCPVVPTQPKKPIYIET